MGRGFGGLSGPRRVLEKMVLEKMEVEKPRICWPLHKWKMSYEKWKMENVPVLKTPLDHFFTARQLAMLFIQANAALFTPLRGERLGG